jgi:RHS repeat-associated protein
MTMTHSHRNRFRRRLVALSLGLAVPTLTLVGVPAARAATAPPPAVQASKPVPVHAVQPNKARVVSMPAWHAPATSWPAAGTATVALPASGLAAAGKLPVRVGPATASGVTPAVARTAAVAETTTPALAGVTVSMRSQQAAAVAGVKGVLFTVGGAGGPAGGRVRVSLDYGSFASAYGGDYAARLRLVELPGCVLTTPQVPACRVQTPLGSSDDVRAGQLAGDVTVPSATTTADATADGAGLAAGGSAPEVVLAATPAPSGSGGDFTAAPLSEAGTWGGAGSSGAFTYSYPIAVPPVPGGLSPDVSLGYSSQAVDGLTSSTNDQASWIGDGWDYSPGYVERDYQSCETEPPGATNWSKSGDLCWSSNDTVTLSLAGQDTTLVQDSSTGAWHPEVDNGERVQYETGTTNGTNDGGYWVVTTTDGTSYYFGLNELPGYASGDAATNSAWTAPVFATSSGQPCYKAAYASSYCSQAWQWNLDYVTDPHGDAIAYFYNTPETNYYARDNGTTANSAYTQAGALSKIEYGLRAGAVYGHTPVGQVTFTTGTARTDVPTDLTCASGASCDVNSPTFWGKYQLTAISTQALEGTALAGVDSWALAQTYPSTGDPTSPPALWLSSITHTGADTGGGGSSASVPAVKFAGIALANRVMTPADLSDGYSIITRYRLSQITEETGGQIGVAYDTPGGACTSGSFPAPDANTALCYPDYWSPPGVAGPVLDWFNKYAVTAVTQANTVGGGVPVQTSYSYAGAAWHYDDDTLTRSAQRTWDQWRGFRTVTTEAGTSPDPVTETADTYFQGMNGDYQAGGGTSAVSLTSSRGDVATDSDQYAGMGFEHIAYDGAGGAQASDKITIPWSSAATATQPQPSPLPALTAHLTGTAETKTYTPLASGATRESDAAYAHDSYGRITQQSSVPDTADPAEDTCATTTYASNTTAWLLDLPAEVTDVSVPCTTTPALPGDAVSDVLTFYDGATSLSADTPTTGNVTKTQDATSYSGSAPVYTTESTAAYDEYGRVLTAGNADSQTTTTAYTPATGAEPTSVSVTDPAGLLTATVYDPARDLPVQVTNPAGRVTSETYDGLGRLTAVWEPGHPKADKAAADEEFSYAVSATAASAVTTGALNDTGAYTDSETLYDSLGRTAETQSLTPDGGRDITDTYYNSLGLTAKVSNSYYTTGGLTDVIYGAVDSQVPSQTGYFYDGDQRVTRQVSYSLGTETWETDTAYQGGDATTVSYQNLEPGQPVGGTPQTTLTNGEGQTSAIYQYHSEADAAIGPAAPATDYDKTTYTHTPAQQLASIADAAGNTWTYGYDLVGDQTSQSDPDAGTSTSIYDPAGLLTSVTDARNDQVSYAYDADGRKTAEYDTTGGAAESSSDELASWVYDTLAKGEQTSSTSYYNGSAYTQEAAGYNSYGLPTGTKTVIPSSQGTLAGTYTTGDTYDPDTMQLTSLYQSAAGGLPAETVGSGFDTAGDPVSLASSLWSYATTVSYSEYGQPLQYDLGSSVYVTNAYDQQTQRLTGQQVETQSNTAVVGAYGYAYDNAGNVLSDSDTPSAGPAQDQCLQYDYLGRLSQAWSQGSSSCSAGPSQSAESGAAAPYWGQYSYNDENDMTQEVSTPASGAATTTTDAHASAGSAQPHGISSQTVATSAGSTTTNYAYNADGQLTSESGASTDSLTWNPTGQLASMTASGGTTGYIYDASGNLLIQTDPGSTTLYLPDEEITLTGSTLSGTRYYSIGGVTIAARTSSGQISYLAGDQQGTQTLAVNATTSAVTQRFYDPYGNTIGAAASSWPGDQGFQNGTADAATDLTDLGAREYDPGTSAFISPDPLLDPSDPQDLNPYAYAQDTPPSGEDPTGQYTSYQTPTGSYVGTGQSYQTMQDDQQSGGYGTTGKTEPGGADGSAPTPSPVVHQPTPSQTSSGGCGFFGLDCAASWAKHTWDSFTSSQMGGCLWSSIQSDCPTWFDVGLAFAAAIATEGEGGPGGGDLLPLDPPSTENGINEGVNSVSNIGAGAASRSAETLARAEPGSVFSGVYDPASGQLSAYPSVEDPSDPDAPVNAVRMYGGHGTINRAVFGNSNSTVGFTAFLDENGDGISMGWRSRSVNGANFGQIEAPTEYRQSIMDIIAAITGRPVSG